MHRYKNAADSAPSSGPITGSHAYDPLKWDLLRNGRSAWTIRGPKSRAGLIAYPVVPPSDKPMTHTRKVTGIAPIDPSPIGVSSPIEASVKCKIVKIKTKVPTTSLTRL